MAHGNTRIRMVRADDAEELAVVLTNSAEHLRPWEPARDAAFFTAEGQRDWIFAALAGAETGCTAPFVIESGSGEIVGRVTLSQIVRSSFQSCSLGYWIRADRLRRGHATDAVKLSVSYAFETLLLHRVQAGTLPENLGSQKVLQAAGFSRFGFAPRYLRINGAWRDHIMFQLLNE